jgi:uncharacterized protein (TIGR03437 family)
MTAPMRAQSARYLVLSILLASAAFAGPQLSIPFVFEKNAGQVDRQVRYFGRAQGAALWLVDSGAVLSVEQKNRRAVLRMKLEGARPHPRIEGNEPLAGKTNYFIGNDPTRWKRDIGQYGAVRYQDAYPGVDLLFHATAQTIEYDWIVSPGADPRQIRMSFQGASETRIDSSGDLVLRIGDVEVREKRPRIFQDGGEVQGRFVRRGRAIGFEVSKYDRSRPLTIDPVLTYATYLGGSGNALNQIGDSAQGVAMDAQGNAIVVGWTASTNFPTQNSLYAASASDLTAFVTKVNPAATGSASLVWSTYLGGANGTNQGYAVALDSQSSIYVAGITEASDFPLMNPFQTSSGTGTTCVTVEGNQAGCFLGFVTKFSSNGNEIVYSSFLGGTAGSNYPSAIAVDSTGSAWITGVTQSEGFPVAGNSIQRVLSSGQNGFVTKVIPDGSQLLYSTYLGGGKTDNLTGIAVDSAGNAYVAGWSESVNFPTVNAYQAALPSKSTVAGVVAKINPNVRPSLVYSTYLGGAGAGSSLNGIAVDSTGDIFVVGQTSSSSFPVTANAVQPGSALGFEASVVAELNPTAQAAAQLEYSTYLTGGFLDGATSVALDPTGRIVVAGGASVLFPTTPDAFEASFGSGSSNSGYPTKAYLSIVDPTVAGLKGLVYSTFYGGTHSEALLGMGLNPAGTAATIVGQSSSRDLFVTPSAYQLGSSDQYGDVFIATFNFAQTGPTLAAMVNAASFAAPKDIFSPGEIVTLFGSNLGPSALVGAELDTTGHLASTLGGCQLLVNRIPAPLVYVQANQVSAILPYELTPLIGGSLTNYAQMVCNGIPGNVLEFSVAAAAPAIFSAASSGTGQAAVLNQNGSYNSASNPAAAGSIVTIFETGEGVLTPAGQDGHIETGALSTIPKPALPVTVTFGTTASPKITYAAVAPGEVDGLLQIDAEVPSGLAAGNVPIVVTIGTTPSQTGLTIAVKK